MAVELDKNHRKRKRNFYNGIREQMEFYFGDANLSKDRFLKQIIDKDPFVPLELFMTFNKMKKMVTCVEDIAKSLTNSKLLELDDTHQKVRRKTAIPIERNMDDKTLYVESLPVTADHDWVRQTFERFGPITYISLPRYKRTRKIKQFAFVEFEKDGCVEKAIAYFNEFDGVLSIGEMDPGELISVKSFIKEQNNENNLDDNDSRTVNETKKRLKKNSSDDDAPKHKKIKSEAESEYSTATTGAETDTTADDSIDDGNHDDEQKKKKKKKRRKKKKRKKMQQPDLFNTNGILENDNENRADQTFYELRIISKLDWKKIRNKYLNLQREKVGLLKRKEWEEQRQAKNRQAKQHSLEGITVTLPPPAKKSKPNERRLQKMNMNFYGAGEDDAQTKSIVKEIKQNRALESSPLFNYEPGLIVEVIFKEPCTNIKDFKVEMRQNTSVQYVDVKEGAMHAYIRLKSSLGTDHFMRQLNCAEYQCKLLTGEAENEYWKKIEHDREMKLNKQVKAPTKRGREKVKKLITKHIRFGDEDE